MADTVKTEAAKTRRNNQILYAASAALLVSAGAFLALQARKGQNAGANVQAMTVNEPLEAKTWVILRNPTHDELKQALIKAGLTEGVFDMTLSSDVPGNAAVISVTAVLNEYGRLEVRDPETGKLISWKDKRNVGSLKRRAALVSSSAN